MERFVTPIGLLAEPGVNPNSHFVRALRDALANERDNVIQSMKIQLCGLYTMTWLGGQPDGKELQAFIETLVTPSDDSTNKWQPSRPWLICYDW